MECNKVFTSKEADQHKKETGHNRWVVIKRGN